VVSTIFKGVHYEMKLLINGTNYWLAHSTKAYEPGSTVGIELYPVDIHVMKADQE